MFRVNFALLEGRYSYFVATVAPLLIGRVITVRVGRAVVAALVLMSTIGFIAGYRDLVAPTPGSSKRLAEELEAAGYHTAVGDYWSTFKMTFESNEQIVASPLPGQPDARYRPYAATVQNSNPAYVFNVSSNKPQLRALERDLRRSHIAYRLLRAGWYEALVPESSNAFPSRQP
jgi:hypothetical protein